jgi:DNA polymerase-1
VNQEPLLVVDGDNLAHRAYHSTPKTVRGINDEPINAYVGFLSMLVRYWQNEKPRAIFVAWDTLGVDTYRNRLWPAYQGGRIFEPEIKRQLEQFPKLCQAFGFGVAKEAGFEADDLMAAAALAEVAAGGTCLLFTSDKDSYQLASDKITILSPKRGTPDPDRIGPHQVVERMGVLPEQVPDFKAIAGDSSDKIPGSKGIGPKGACNLLLRHGTLENVIEGWPEADAKQALMFREVARMRHDAKVELPTTAPNWQAGADLIQALGASQLAARLRTIR